MFNITKIVSIVSSASITLSAGDISSFNTPVLWMDFAWLTWTVGVTAALLFMLIAFIFQHSRCAQRLQMKKEKFQTLYNNSSDMNISVLPDSTILQCNETFLKKMGYSREEIIGSSLFNIYHEDSPEYEKNTIFNELPQTDIIKNRKMILKREDGKKLHFNLNVDSVKDNKGKIHHYISSWQDITEKIEFQEYLDKQIGKIRSLDTNINTPQDKYKNSMFWH